MNTITADYAKASKRTIYRKAMYLLMAMAVSIGSAYPMSVKAQSAPSASITVNGKRSTVLPYGSNAMLAWTSSGFGECAVTPGSWKDLQGNRTVHEVTAKQTYQLSCKGTVGSATAYATFAVAPPTYTYLQDYLLKNAKDHGTNTSLVKGISRQIAAAEAYYQSRQLDESRKILKHTVARVNKLADQGKLSTSNARNYMAAVNQLIASWVAPTPMPDVIPDDSIILDEPLNGGYPALWAGAPISSIVDPWGMYNRQSVSYTAFKVHQDFLAGKNSHDMPYWGGRGNANQWDDNAIAAGISVDTNPLAGAIAISNAGVYGHAMYVEEVGTVNGQPAIYVSQYNAKGDGTYSEGWRPVSGLVFIHF